MPAAVQAVCPRYPMCSTCSGSGSRSSSNSRPCSPARFAAARRPARWLALCARRSCPLPSITATPTSGHPALALAAHATACTFRTLGPRCYLVNDLPRRVADRSAERAVTHGSGGSRGAAEVLRRDVVEEFPELFDFVFLLVRDGYARFVKYVVVRENSRAGSQGKRDRIRRPRADRGAIREHQVGEEDPVAQRGDVDLPQLDAKR